MQRWHGTCEDSFASRRDFLARQAIVLKHTPTHSMNNIVYIIGAVVIIIVVLKVLGLF